jgi:cytochrome c-type biogenesis protein CcmH/NrfG
MGEKLEARIARLRNDVKATPREPLPRIRLGDSLLEASQWEAAADAFRQALGLNPVPDDAIDAHFGLAKAAGMLDRCDESAEHLQAILPQRADFATVHSLLGSALVKLGRFEEADKALNEAVRLEPNDAGTHRMLGALRLAQGRDEEAARAFERATNLDPHRVEAFVVLGTTYLKLGRNESAVKTLRQAVRLDAKSVDAWHNLGRAYVVTNDTAGLAEVRKRLPTLGEEGQRLDRALAEEERPAESSVGEPFWALMQVGPDGQVNGNYMGIERGTQTLIPLFFTRKDAEDAASRVPGHVVRGLNKVGLYGLLKRTSNLRNNWVFALFEPGGGGGRSLTADEMIETYVDKTLRL